MIVVCAPDSYKESMTAPEAAQAMADGVRDAVPDAVIIQLPMSCLLYTSDAADE